MQYDYENRYQSHLDSQPQQLACPRCDSIDTKFCYYNNYNLSQPRHYCKSCKRYWTHGGSLRNVPVGGSKRSPPSESAPHEDMTLNGPVSDDKSYLADINLNETPVYDTWQVQGGGYYVG